MDRATPAVDRATPRSVAVAVAFCAAIIAIAGVILAAAAPPHPAAAQTSEPTPSTPNSTDQPDELRIPFPQDDGSLTPYTFELGYSLMTLVYDTLLWRDADGEPQPWLAEEVATSDDGRRVTVRLAGNARWHDDQPVTAADVAFTFEYIADRFHPRFTGQLDAIEDVATPNEHTVVFELAHPSPGFEDQPLADVPILPAHRWQDLPTDQQAPDGAPVGSGPYELEGYDPDEGYEFTANADYFRGEPAIATLDVPIIGEADATLRALESGEADLLPLPLPEGLQRRLAGLGIDFLSGTSYLGTELRFNTHTAPFDDAEARRAVAAAVNLDRVARAIGGDTVPADRGYLHPDSPWAASEVVHTADVDVATERLAALDLPAVEVVAPDNDPVKVEAGRQVAVALRRAGLDAQLDTRDRDAHAAALGLDGSQPTFQLGIASGFPLASHDPDFLAQVFGADPEPGPLNHADYASDAFDAAAADIARSPDPQQRQAAVDRALEVLAADVPVLPLVFPDGAFAYRSRVYNDWVFVHGSGPLDKRSFLAGATNASDNRGDTPDTPAPTPPDDPAPLDLDREVPLPLLAAAGGSLVAVSLGLGIVGLWRRRRP